MGHLLHAATVIRQGRVFLCHLFAILKAAHFTHHFVHLDAAARADLLWWEFFLVHWNGRMFPEDTPLPLSHVFTDASGSFGCRGVLMPSRWFQIRWPQAWAGIDISVKELVLIVAAAAIWGRHWHCCFHSDNMAVVSILQNQTARDELALHLLWCFQFFSAFFQFQYSVQHMPGMLNIAADAVSHDNIALFSSLVPQASRHFVPNPVLDLLVNQRPNWGSPHWTALFVSTLSTL